MNDKKIQYDPQTGGFIMVNGGLPQNVTDSLKSTLKSSWGGTISSSSSSSTPLTAVKSNGIKYSKPASHMKLDRNWIMNATEKYSHPSSLETITIVHDALMKILKGEVEGKEDYWKEDRDTLIEYLSQVLYSIINPEAEEKIKETLVNDAIKKLGGIGDIRAELDQAMREIREKDTKIMILEERIHMMKEELDHLMGEFKSLEYKVNSSRTLSDWDTPTTPGRDYDSWNPPYC